MNPQNIPIQNTLHLPLPKNPETTMKKKGPIPLITPVVAHASPTPKPSQ